MQCSNNLKHHSLTVFRWIISSGSNFKLTFTQYRIYRFTAYRLYFCIAQTDMRNLVYFIIPFLIFACNGVKTDYTPDHNERNFENMLDTILPFFAKLHDSIPESGKFSPQYRGYMNAHKKERDYQFLYFSEHSDSYSYFMITRKEPSIKNDKYVAICGRFKRNKDGQIDTAAYEELFWTWKMKMDELKTKSDKLFRTMLETGSVDDYLPGKSDGEWVEFPGNGVVYDKKTHTWIKNSGL